MFEWPHGLYRAWGWLVDDRGVVGRGGRIAPGPAGAAFVRGAMALVARAQTHPITLSERPELSHVVSHDCLQRGRFPGRHIGSASECSPVRRLSDLEARQAAFRAAGALLCQLDAGDFLARYVRTLRLLLRWLGGRCLQLGLQLAIVVCGYFLLTGVVSSFEWMTDEPAWHGDWMFSSSAMIGAALKSYLASS